MSPKLTILLAALVVGGLFVAGLFVPGRAGGVLLAVSDVGVVAVALRAESWEGEDHRRRPVRLVAVAVVTALAVVKLVNG